MSNKFNININSNYDINNINNYVNTNFVNKVNIYNKNLAIVKYNLEINDTKNISKNKLDKYIMNNDNYRKYIDDYLTVLLWNARSLINNIKKQYIYNIVNRENPDIIYIVDTNYNNNNLWRYYNKYYDGRNSLFIREELNQRTKIVKENLIIDEILKMVFVYIVPSTNTDEQNEWVNMLNKYINVNYTIIGDFNLRSNYIILNKLKVHKNNIIGEKTLQLSIINNNTKKVYKEVLAPSDHHIIMAKIYQTYYRKSRYRIEKVKNITDFQTITNLLNGQKDNIDIKYKIKKTHLILDDKYLIIRKITNYFLKNNPSHLYRYFSNNWSKYKKEPILNSNIPISIENSIKIHLKHNDNKAYKLIDKSLCMNTYDIDLKECNKKSRLTKQSPVNLLMIKKSRSNAVNEDFLGLSAISDKLNTYTNNLMILGKYDIIQKFLNNIITLNNRKIKDNENDKAKVFYLIKNSKLENFSDVRMITIIPTLFYTFEALYYNEIANAIDSIINIKSYYQFGGLTNGGTINAMTYLRYKLSTKYTNYCGFFISDIAYGYDSVDLDILNSYIDLNDKLNLRIKNLMKIWNIMNYNMDIWIGARQCKRTIGVPMGCALSPMIFIFYVNETIKNFKYLDQLVMYLDDLLLILNEENTPTKVIKELNILLNKGKLYLKEKKSKIITDKLYIFKDINEYKIDNKFTFLGRDMEYNNMGLQQNDENVLIIDQHRIKKYPNWLILPEKKLLFDGALQAKQRFIGFMYAINNIEYRKSHFKNIWDFYKVNFTNYRLSYKMIIFIITNIFRMFFDNMQYLQLSKIYWEKYNEINSINIDLNNKYNLTPKIDNVEDLDLLKNRDDNIIFYTDGSYNEKLNLAGYGIVIIYNKIIIDIYCTLNNKKLIQYRNVYGELEAVKEVFNLAKTYNWKNFEINYDYIGVENWINGTWKTNELYTYQYADYINKTIKELNINVKFKHIKGHSGNVLNDRADNLAKKGANKKLREKFRTEFTEKNKDIKDIIDTYFKNKIYTGIEQIDELIKDTKLNVKRLDKDLNIKNSFYNNKKLLDDFKTELQINIIKENINKINTFGKDKFILKYYREFMLNSILINKHVMLLECCFFKFQDKEFPMNNNKENSIRILHNWIRYCDSIVGNKKLIDIDISNNIDISIWLVNEYEKMIKNNTNNNKLNIFVVKKFKNKDIITYILEICKFLYLLQKTYHSIRQWRHKKLNLDICNFIKKLWSNTRALIFNLEYIWNYKETLNLNVLIDKIAIKIRENKHTIKMISECDELELIEKINNWEYDMDNNEYMQINQDNIDIDENTKIY